MTRGIYGVPVTQLVADLNNLLDVTIEDMHRGFRRSDDLLTSTTINDPVVYVSRQQRRYEERQRRKRR